jgi:hypothetical protein
MVGLGREHAQQVQWVALHLALGISWGRYVTIAVAGKCVLSYAQDARDVRLAVLQE